MMTNSEVIRALGRWPHDPSFSERGRRALRRAAVALLGLSASIEERAAAGSLQGLRRVGPFVERIILEVLRGIRPAAPDPSGWPAAARRVYERTVSGYDTFLAVRDARQAAADRALPPPREVPVQGLKKKRPQVRGRRIGQGSQGRYT